MTQRTRAPLAALLALSTSALAAAAQQGREEPSATLTGTVVSALTGRPLPNAMVVLQGSGAGAVTDSFGRFRIPSAPPGPDTAAVRLIGFEESRLPLELRAGATTDVTLLLSQTAVRLADIQVTVKRDPAASGRLRDFYRRRARGFGHFVSPEWIEARNPQQPSDLLRSVPGLSVSRSVLGRAAIELTRGSLNCEPLLYVDGQPSPNLHIDDLNAQDIIAIEVYRGASEVPTELMYRGGCGLIVLWTRGGEPDD